MYYMSAPHHSDAPPPPLDTMSLREVHTVLDRIAPYVTDETDVHLKSWMNYLGRACDEARPIEERRGAIFGAVRAARATVYLLGEDFFAAGIYYDDLLQAQFMTRAASHVQQSPRAVQSLPRRTVAETHVWGPPPQMNWLAPSATPSVRAAKR